MLPGFTGREAVWRLSAEWEAEERREPPPRESRVEKWTRWLKRIENEIIAMHSHRDVFRNVGEIVDDHGSLPPSHFFSYLTDWYASTQATAVRRQADTHPQVESLGRLLKEIRDDPGRLTRDRFVDQYDTLNARRGREAWDEKFGGEVGTHVDPGIVAAGLDALVSAADRVKQHVDKHVAHADEDPLSEPLTFEELNAAIDGISDLFEKYSLLLTASSWATLVPVMQYDWKAVFRVPWIKPEGNAGATRPAETGRDSDASASADSS
jgi:hypothetical protein